MCSHKRQQTRHRQHRFFGKHEWARVRSRYGSSRHEAKHRQGTLQTQPQPVVTKRSRRQKQRTEQSKRPEVCPRLLSSVSAEELSASGPKAAPRVPPASPSPTSEQTGAAIGQARASLRSATQRKRRFEDTFRVSAATRRQEPKLPQLGVGACAETGAPGPGVLGGLSSLAWLVLAGGR